MENKLTYFFIEDNLNVFENGKHPQLPVNGRRPQLSENVMQSNATKNIRIYTIIKTMVVAPLRET